MYYDHNHNYLKPVHNVLSNIIAPIEYLVDLPVKMIDWFSTSVASRTELQNENAHLRAQHLLLEAKLQKILALEKENSSLRELLASSSHLKGDVLVAQLLAVNLEPFVQQVILDKGRKHKVYVGQPVLDSHGVMGQVIEVNFSTSRVLLITDSHSALPIQVSRNGVRAIAKGNGAIGTLSLLHVPKSVDIRAGDVLIASGLGQRFPYGYPVGIVNIVEKNPGDDFSKIKVNPSGHLNRSRQVLLVWPKYQKIQADNETDKA